jgi:hypothetical protein
MDEPERDPLVRRIAGRQGSMRRNVEVGLLPAWQNSHAGSVRRRAVKVKPSHPDASSLAWTAS